MSHEDLPVLGGQVEKMVPDGRRRVHPENDHRTLARRASMMRHLRIHPVEIFSRDPGRVRVIFCERAPGAGSPSRRLHERPPKPSIKRAPRWCAKEYMYFQSTTSQLITRSPNTHSRQKPPAVPGATLSRQDLQRIVAQMID